MTTMTRSIFGVLAVLLTAATLAPRPGEAAPYWPWCSQHADRDTAHTSCAFVSWEQCMQTVSGIGGYCYHNLYPEPVTRSAMPRRQASR
jgi:hypothetical protein